MSKRKLYWLGLMIWQALASCNSLPKVIGITYPLSIKEIRLVDAYYIPHNLQFIVTTVCGLSGIDYDPGNDQYYIICDDRSKINPARFYTAKIKLKEQGIDSVYFTGVTSLLAENGGTYQNTTTDPFHAPDTEALRYSVMKKQLLISSEGERIVKEGKVVLEDPFIHWMKLNGQLKDSFELAPQTRMYAAEKGLRQNGVFEGLAFGDNYKSLYISIEEPLYEDGQRVTTKDSAWIRILKYDLHSRKPVAQYAYRVNPVAHPPTKAGGSINNGVSDILYLGNNQLLVIERSYSAGRSSNTVQVYLADLSKAADITAISSLQHASFQPASKKLLMNMDTLNRHIDNIEGVCFGPTLKNGHQSLIFVTDNNFAKDQRTQFFLFEIIPAS